MIQTPSVVSPIKSSVKYLLLMILYEWNVQEYMKTCYVLCSGGEKRDSLLGTGTGRWGPPDMFIKVAHCLEK